MRRVMSQRADSKDAAPGAWTAEEVAREQAATRSRLARARDRGAAHNVRESAVLARFANRVAAAAESARRRAGF